MFGFFLTFLNIFFRFMLRLSIENRTLFLFQLRLSRYARFIGFLGLFFYVVVATLFMYLYVRKHFMCSYILRNVTSYVWFTHMASLIGFFVGMIQRSIQVCIHQR